MEDIKKLSNTVRYSIWNQERKGFSDYIISTKKVKERLAGTGFKQSNGWLKLAAYDTELQKLYKTFLEYNKSKIESSHLSAQFYAQMANNYQRNIK